MMVDYKALKDMGRKAGGVISATAKAYGIFLSFSNLNPSTTRFLMSNPESDSEDGIAASILISAVFNGILNAGMHPYLASKIMGGNYSSYILPFLGISAGTNILSGLYEWYRYERDKNKTALDSSSGLEEEVEKSENEPKPEKPKIINPWDQEFEEIENKRYGEEK